LVALGFLQALPLNEGRPLLTLKDVCVVVYGAVKECGEDVGVRGQGCLAAKPKGKRVRSWLVDPREEERRTPTPPLFFFRASATPTVKPCTSQTAHHVPSSPYFAQAHFPRA
jgi:hypothetical protein